MFERKCVKCGNRVFVESKTTTKVKCDNCKKSRKVDYLWKSGTYIELKHLIDKSGIEKLRVFSFQYPEKKICVLEKRSPEWKYLERLYKSKLVLWETGKQNIRLMPELYK